VHGIAVGLFVGGDDPNAGTQLTEAKIRAILRPLVGHTEWIRLYGTGLNQDLAARIAKEYGLNVAVGIYLSRDSNLNLLETERAIEVARSGHADMVVVGNEVLLRRDVPVAELVSRIESVKRAIGGKIPVTTAEPLDQWLASPQLRAAVDVILLQDYPYWAGVHIDKAVASLAEHFDSLAALEPGKEVWLGETGWGSCGQTIGAAVPSPENAAAYLKAFATWARVRGVRYFLFEAVDEAWKAKGPEGALGGCWGLAGADYRLKPGMAEVFREP
jgi:GPH family glycoside/pentoside/hexuronide:cation symporter